MRELNSQSDLAVPLAKLDDTFQRRFMFVVIKPKAVRRYACFGRNRRCFRYEQAGTVYRELAEMHKMPIRRRAIIRAVLPHWGDDNAVR